MKRVKKRIFAGDTCDQIVYYACENRAGKIAEAVRPRFKTDFERIEHKRLIAKRHCIRLVNANFTTAGYFSTLTFDDENEINTPAEARQIRRRYRRRIQYKYPDAKIMIFFGVGKSTHRIHFHALIEGAPEEDILAAWTWGEIRKISHLRSNNKTKSGQNIGADFSAVAAYCFDHWQPEHGGHYYSRTANFRQPEEEKPELSVMNYTQKKPPRAPKAYVYVPEFTQITPYGFSIFHYCRIRD